MNSRVLCERICGPLSLIRLREFTIGSDTINSLLLGQAHRL
jgi:hypothetical protein